MPVEMVLRPPILQFEEGWRVVQATIDKLRRAVAVEAADSRRRMGGDALRAPDVVAVYTVIYNMCLQNSPRNFSAQLYERYRDELLRFVRESLQPTLIRSYGSDNLLRIFIRTWRSYSVFSKGLQSFFRYLNKFYIPRKKLPSLCDVSRLCYRSVLLKNAAPHVRRIIVDQIRRCREQEVVDRASLGDAIRVFVESCSEEHEEFSYEHMLQESILGETRMFYSEKCRDWFRSMSCRDYCRTVRDTLDAEEYFYQSSIPSVSHQPMRMIVRERLLESISSQVFDSVSSEVPQMLKQAAVEDLKLLFQLYRDFEPGIAGFSARLRQQVVEDGERLRQRFIAAGENDAVQYVHDVVSLQESYSSLLSASCSGSLAMHKALCQALSSVLDKPIGRHGTEGLIVKFLDHHLSQASGKRAALDAAIELVQLVNHKDMFAALHQQALCTRLLRGPNTSSCYAAEREILSKLKRLYGTALTSRMEAMVNDVDNDSASSELTRRTNALCESRDSAVQLQVRVLTRGCWPTLQPQQLRLPHHLQTRLDAFQSAYKQATVGRKLEWLHALSKMSVERRCGTNRVLITLSVFQAIVLLLFNDSARLRISEILELTGASVELSKHQLRPLVAGKHKLLSKDPASGFDESHFISINRSFSTQSRSIRVPESLVPSSKAAAAAKQAIATVKLDRIHVLEASIIRTMKRRRMLSRQQLVAEVLAQVSSQFQPQVRDVNRRIDELISREYLESDDDSNVIRYLA